MNGKILRYIGLLLAVGAVLAAATTAAAQDDPPYDLRINYSEADFNDVIDCAVDARVVNFGEWVGDSQWLGIGHWFVNLNDADIDVKPNNRIDINATDLEIQADIVLGILDIIFDDPDEHVNCTIQGEVIGTGDETEGLVLAVRVDAIVIHDIWGNNPDWVEALMQLIGNIVFLVAEMPDTQINMGTRFLPDFLDGFFTSSIPGVATTETGLYVGYDVNTRYLPLLTDPYILSGYYEAEQMIEAGLMTGVANGTDVELAVSESGEILLLPGFHAHTGSEFRAGASAAVGGGPESEEEDASLSMVAAPAPTGSPANAAALFPDEPLQHFVGEWREGATRLEVVNEKGEVVDVLESEGVWVYRMSDGEAVAPPADKALDESQVPQGYDLARNVPNPFNPSTEIAYDLPRDVRVRLSVFDVAGRRVRTLVDEVQTAGSRSVVWDGTGDDGSMVPSGLYLYRLEAGEFEMTRGMTMLK